MRDAGGFDRDDRAPVSLSVPKYLGLSALALEFNGSAEAQAELVWGGHRERCRLGLDGVERFSTNSFDNLPAAGKGRWLGDGAFLLQVDLVGGINCYRFKLTFSEQGKQVQVALTERTGLIEESFDGAEAR